MIARDLTAPRMLAGLIAIALAVIALVGCGGSTKTVTTTAPHNTTEQPATTGTTPATTPEEDKRIATDASLKLSDFPSGWQQKDSTTESNDEAKCPGWEAAKAAASAQQKSPSFTKVGEGVTSTVLIFSDASSATRAFDQASGEGDRRCLADEITKAAKSAKEEGVEYGEITSGRVSMAPVGDQSAVSRFTIPIKASGLSVESVIDQVFARVGRGVAYLAFADIASPFDEALRNRLTTTVVDRLKKGLG